MMTLRQVIDFTFENKDEWIEGTGRGAARINCNHVLRLLDPEMDVADITPKTFNDLKRTLKEEYITKNRKRSNGGINRILAALSTAINYCHKMGEIETTATYIRLKEKEQPAKYYTEDEMDSLFEASKHVGDDAELLYDSLLFAYYTGDRQGELLKVLWSDVSFEDNTVTFRDTKNHEDHTIPLSKELKSMLEVRYHHRTCDQVFPWSGCRRGADALRRNFKRAKKIAGLKADSRLWHSIRHTTGTHLASKGVPLRTVMGVLNHKNINTTLRYAKNTSEAVANAIDLL